MQLANSSGRGIRLSKGLDSGPGSRRSASSSTRCSTPTVSFRPQTGQRPFSGVGFLRLQTAAAGPVAVQMVLAFLREKLDRPFKTFAGFQRMLQFSIGQLRRKADWPPGPACWGEWASELDTSR